MKALSVEDILPIDSYERDRGALRKEAIALRELRRFVLDDSCVIIFENRKTVQYQVQEMLRVDRQDTPERIALELSCFNLLIPGPNELSATLLLRIPEYRDVDNILKKLNGITRECLSLVIGGQRVFAKFDVDEDSVACGNDVFYIRFPMTEDLVRAFRDPGVSAMLCAEHEKCRAEVVIGEEARRSLIEDLRT